MQQKIPENKPPVSQSVSQVTSLKVHTPGPIRALPDWTLPFKDNATHTPLNKNRLLVRLFRSQLSTAGTEEHSRDFTANNTGDSPAQVKTTAAAASCKVF